MVLLIILLASGFIGSTNFASAKDTIDTSTETQLTEDDKQNAIEIINLNERPIKVETGENVLYKLVDEDI